LRPYNPAQGAEPFRIAQVVDAGDIACNPFNIPEALKQIEAGIDEIVSAGIKPVTLGGDHTIVLPILRALSKQHGEIAVVHFDAHLDTWDTYFGAEYTHGTPFRRASEEGLLDLNSCLHVGIRGPLYSPEDLPEDARLGFKALAVTDMDLIGPKESLKLILDRLRGRTVYVSIDIDVLDPAFAPGTGTPEAGGLSSRELLSILRGFDQLNLVGADIVEVAPAYDHAQITAIAASHLAYDLISILGRQLNAK
jgi:agmatinase